MRQLAEPFPQQPIDLLPRQAVAQSLHSLGVVARQDPVNQRLVADSAVRQLLLHIFVTVQAEFGVVREVRAEFQEEGAKIPIHAVGVKVVDHGRGADQPGIGRSGLLIAPPLGAEHRRFLLRLADEQHSFRAGKLLPILRGHAVLTLALLERHDGYLFLFGKLLHLGDERLGDRIHQRTGGKPVAEMEPEETGHSSRPLQRRHVHVQVHAVDSLDLQRHVLPENLGDRP